MLVLGLAFSFLMKASARHPALFKGKALGLPGEQKDTVYTVSFFVTSVYFKQGLERLRPHCFAMLVLGLAFSFLMKASARHPALFKGKALGLPGEQKDKVLYLVFFCDIVL